MDYLDRHRILSSGDLDELREHVDSEIGPHEFQLHGPGVQIEAHIDAAPLAELSLFHVTYGPTDIDVTVRESPADTFLFCLLTEGDGRIRRTDVRNGAELDVGPGDVLIRDMRLPAFARQKGFACFGIPVPRHRISRHAEALFGPAEARFGVDFEVADMQGPAGRMLGETFRLVAGQLNAAAPGSFSPLVLAAWEDLLLTQILTVLPGRMQNLAYGRPVSGAMPYHVKRARDLIHARAHERIELSDLAHAAGCSLRTLQGAFVDATGLSPMAYLKRVRLERAHAELEASGSGTASVAEIARRWGFAHAGRFATEYARRYGRNPSETLYRDG